MEFKFCIESFVRWEQMTGRGFQTLDPSAVEDVNRLLYCAYLIGSDTTPQFDTFIATLRQKRRIMAKAIRLFEAYNLHLAQFSEKLHHHALTADKAEAERKEVFLGEVVARLVVAGGLDARYVMRELTIPDLLLYVRALDDKTHQEMEAQRLFTYLTILPHVQKGKLPSPQKLYTFPWEVEQQMAEAQRNMEANKETFEKFMRGELIDINKIKWKQTNGEQ